MQVLLPDGWDPPIGYANGIAVTPGRIVFIAGQVGWNAQQQFTSDQIAPQFDQALRNVLAVLAKAVITDCLPMPKNNRLINQRASH